MNQKNHEESSPSVSLASNDEFGEALILSVDSPIGSWSLDPGASFRSSPCKKIIRNFKRAKFGKVYLAEDKLLDITGKRDLLVENFKWELI